jgi:hypothetical protein
VVENLALDVCAVQSPTTFPAEQELVEESMNKDDKLWVKAAIADAVEPLHPHGWKKALLLAQRIGTPIAIVAFVASTFIALLMMALSFHSQATARAVEEAAFRTSTKDTLDQIQATLRSLQASQSPKKVLQEIAGLDSKQFLQNLPALRKVAEQPPAQAEPSSFVIRAVANKLRTVDENSPDYWPTVLQFLQFASEGLSSDVPAPGPPELVLTGEKLHIGAGGLSGMNHRIVELDGVHLSDVTFENSRIIFTDKPVQMHNVTFINCVFEMPQIEHPSPSLKQVTQEMLASNLKSFTIQAL